MRVKILDVAERDLASGFDFYEQQEQGLGEYFLHSLAAEIEAWRLYAGVHRKEEDFHRCPAKRFPFVIYYPLVGDLVSIEAAIDTRRDPDQIRKRLRGF